MTFLENMDRQTLKELIKESIREVLKEENINLYSALIPYVDDKEQQEIETQCGSPTDYESEELIDMTDWVNNGN